MATDEPPPALPWHADPRMGAVIGMTFLFFCLVGPLALLIPLIAWLWMRRNRQVPPAAGPKARRPRRLTNLG